MPSDMGGLVLRRIDQFPRFEGPFHGARWASGSLIRLVAVLVHEGVECA